MKTLNGIELPADVRIVQRGHSAGVRTAVFPALSGEPVCFVGSDVVRFEVASGPDYGWFTREQAQALIRLARTDAGPFVFQYEDELMGAVSMHVMFDSSQGAAVRFSELWPGSEYLTGVIRLIKTGGE